MLKTKQIIFSLVASFTVFANSNISFSQSLSNPGSRTGRDNSPYNVFGIGTLSPTSLSSLRGMGGGGTAFTDPFTVNSENPASYSFLNFAHFEFNADFKTRNVTFENQPSKSSFTGSINNIQIGIPMKNIGGLSFGIHQVSNIYYNLTDTITILNDRTIRQYAGTGSFQNAYVGFSITKFNLSLGANFGYTFGNRINGYNLYNFENVNLRDVDDERSTKYGGFMLNLGAIYQIKLKNSYFLNIGARYQKESILNGSKDGYTVGKTYKYDSKGIQRLVSIDTIQVYDNTTGKLNMPSIIGFGVHFGKHEQIDVLADFKYYNWSNYSDFGQKDSIAENSFKSSIGFSYTPDFTALYKSGSSYFSAVTYRAGFYFNKDYVYLRNTTINDIGGTIGFGFPIRRTMSNNQFGKINTAITFGNRGTYQNGLAREYYFNLTFGASFNDIWFIKPVYD